MAERPTWEERHLRAVALAYRSAYKRGRPDLAFEASVRVALRYFPQARDHQALTAAMLHEAVERWGVWLVGGERDGPEDLSDDDANSD